MIQAQTAVSARTAAPPPAASQLFLHEADEATRPLYSRFIAQRFAEAYGAKLYHFLPRLFGLHEASGRLVAAFGLNDAARGPMFVQHYFDQQVVEAVRGHVGRAVPAAQLAEIGNLAGATPGALRQLIPVLTGFLHDQGYTWLLFTGSARLRNGFNRLGLPLRVIAEASEQCLPQAERGLWGTYYQHSPAVMLGDVRGGYTYLRKLARSPLGIDGALAEVSRVGVP